MEEAEYLCDEIAIINNGKIIASDQTQDLKKKYSGVKGIEMKISSPVTFNVLSLIKSSVGKPSYRSSRSRENQNRST